MELKHCDLAYGDNDRARCAWCGDRLHRGRSRWCSTPCSRAYARNHIWSVAQAEALEVAGHRCEKCGLHAEELDHPLEVHHVLSPVRGKKKRGHGCWHHQSNLLVVCRAHHLDEERIERAGDRPVQLTLVA